MPNQLVHMKKVRLIIRLYTEGVSKKTISEKTGCSRNTVKKYINQFISLGKSFDELNQLSNTALEAMIDLISPERNHLAKVSKDVGAAAVLIAALASVLVGLLILGPPLWEKLKLIFNF